MRTLGRGAPRASGTGKSKRYKTDKIIGRGAFGTAYLVRSLADSRLYVMKRLKLDQLGQKERAEAMNECAVLLKLRRHPNIIRVHEHFIDEGKLCIVMDYADGGDLAQRIEAQAASRAKFGEEQVLDWFVQLCLALKHAHDRKVLHRDLKPQNVFLTRKNFVRLGDFGISKILSSTMSVASTCVGTPLYLAPELCEGKEYDNKSDVWSLGAILFELCMLSPPFTANTMPALVMRICANEPPEVDPKAFSAETRALAASLLVKNPMVRPRVHDVLEQPFIQSRIETFLDARLLHEEFSHTILHVESQPETPASTPPPSSRTSARKSTDRSSDGGATPKRPASGANASARPRPRAAGGGGGGGGAPRRAGAPPRAPGGGGAAAAAGGPARRAGGPTGPGGTRKGSPPAGRLSPEEESAARAVQRREAADLAAADREAMRAQIRRDRQSQGTVHAGSGLAGSLSAFEIVLSATPPRERHVTEAAAGPPAAPAAPAVPAGAAPSVPAEVRRALESAHPGTRLLSESERRAAHESLTRRQQEVMAMVSGSQLKGEAGRRMLNEAQRELLEISRMRGAVSKRYVLVRSDPEAAGVADAESIAAIASGAICGVPLEEVSVIDEINDADADAAEAEAEEEGASDPGGDASDPGDEVGEDMGGEEEGEEEEEEEVTAAEAAAAAEAAEAAALAATSRATPARRAGGDGAPGGPLAPTPVPAHLKQSLAWEISPPVGEAKASGGAATSAERRAGPGGIAFDIRLEPPSPQATPPPRAQPGGARPQATAWVAGGGGVALAGGFGGGAVQRAAAPAPPSAAESAANLTSTVPADLFGVGTPLSAKVETLRNHLEGKLGGRAAFLRVYDYVSREESGELSGEQQSGEREGILNFMASKRDMLPLVHTLLYLEEALGAR